MPSSGSERGGSKSTPSSSPSPPSTPASSLSPPSSPMELVTSPMIRSLSITESRRETLLTRRASDEFRHAMQYLESLRRPLNPEADSFTPNGYSEFADLIETLKPDAMSTDGNNSSVTSNASSSSRKRVASDEIFCDIHKRQRCHAELISALESRFEETDETIKRELASMLSMIKNARSQRARANTLLHLEQVRQERHLRLAREANEVRLQRERTRQRRNKERNERAAKRRGGGRK